MAIKYLRSTDGSDADNGTTWALAKATAAGACSAAAAGDDIMVSQAHAETQASAMTITFPGTPTSPNRVICGSDAAEPPTSLSTAATISTTGASNITINGSAYVRGIGFVAGAAAANFANFRINYAGVSEQWYDTCTFFLQDTHPSGILQINSVTAGDSQRTKFTSCGFKLSNTSQSITMCGRVVVNGGSMLSGTSTPTAGLFIVGNISKDLVGEFNAFDFSNCASTLKLVVDPAGSTSCKPSHLDFNRCTLPASWSGTLVDGTVEAPGIKVTMRNCQISGGAKIRMWQVTSGGVVRDELTVIRTGGATDPDGPTGWSLKGTSAAQCSVASPLVFPDIPVFIDTTSATSKTVEFTHASVGSGTAGALTDTDVWVEVIYPGGVASSKTANPLSAAADLTTSTETWASTGGTPLKQKITVNFTASMKGQALVRVHLSKPSVTVYVCSKVA